MSSISFRSDISVVSVNSDPKADGSLLSRSFKVNNLLIGVGITLLVIGILSTAAGVSSLSGLHFLGIVNASVFTGAAVFIPIGVIVIVRSVRSNLDRSSVNQDIDPLEDENSIATDDDFPKPIISNEDTSKEVEDSAASLETVFNELSRLISSRKKIRLNEKQTPVLIEMCERMELLIQTLPSEQRKQNKDLISNIIKTKLAIKEELKNKKGDFGQLKEVLNRLQAAALTYYFAGALEAQNLKLIQLQQRFDFHKGRGEIEEENIEFIQSEINRWQKKLDKGQLVSFPKWFHCTHHPKTVELITESKIKRLHQGAYKGAFVSNLPEIRNYGNYGFALSSRIEKTATHKNGRTILPKVSQSVSMDLVSYGEVHDEPDDNAFQNKQGNANFWFGFGLAIPMKRPSRKENPLSYYRDITISYLFYAYGSDVACDPSGIGGYRDGDGEPTEELADRVKTYAKTQKISCICVTQLEALRTLMNATFPLNFPEEWQGQIQHF